MASGLSFEPTFVIAAVIGLAIAAAIVIIGIQLLMSARSASSHLSNATALSVRIHLPDRDGTSGTLAPAPAGAPQGVHGFVGSLEAKAARPSDSGESADDASGQIVAQLNEYYAANISQGNTMFWASLLAMSAGFAIIFVGVVTARANATTTIVAGIAGVLSQFIAATFLVALRSTQQQSTTYAQSLVELRLRDARATADAQSVTLGLRLLNEISDDGANALANQTRAALAMGLIVKQSMPVSLAAPVVAEPPVDVDDTHRTAPRTQPRMRAESVMFDAPGNLGARRDP